MSVRVETIEVRPIRLIGAACAVAILAACQTELPKADDNLALDQAAELAAAIPTALPIATFAARVPTLPADPVQPPPAVATAEPQADEPASLLRLELGDQLRLVADIPIPRTDFGVRLAFSPQGDMLLHSGGGLIIQRYDLLHQLPATDLTGFELMSPLTISISPDGSAIAADDESHVLVWDNQTGELLNVLPLPPISALASAGFLQDQLYYTVDYNGNVLVWDPHNWGQITQFSYPGRIEAAAAFPNGEGIALQDREHNRITVFDLRGNQLQTIEFQGEAGRLLSVSPTGDRFLLYLDYGLPTEGVAIISAETGEVQLRLELLNFRRFAVSSDWNLLAAVGVSNELRMFSLPDGRLLLSQPLNVSRAISLSMSPDDEYLGLYAIKEPGQGGAIQVWAAEPGS